MHDHARNLAEMEIEGDELEIEGDEEQPQRRQMDTEGGEDEHEQVHHGGQMDFEGGEDYRRHMEFEGHMDFEGAEDDLQQRRREVTERILNTLSEGVSKKLTSMASGVTGSPQYWSQIRKNLKGKGILTRTLYTLCLLLVITHSSFF